MQCSDRNGDLVSAVQVFEGDEMMLISDQGTLVRTRTEEVSVLGRNTQGVRLIRLAGENEKLVGVERIEDRDEQVEELAGGQEELAGAEPVNEQGEAQAESGEQDAGEE